MTKSLSPSYPVLPLRDIVVFPHMIVPLFVGREKSVRALEDVMADDKQILLSSQIDPSVDDPAADGIYKAGVLANVLQLLKLPDGTVKVLVEGKMRVRITGFVANDRFFEARAEELPETPGDPTAVEALIRSVCEEFERYAKIKKNIPEEALSAVSETREPQKLADLVAGHLGIEVGQKQDLLETLGAPRVRADVERKRLGGLSALQPSGSPPGGGLYGAAMSQATYQRLFTAAAAALEGGWPVILDAGFLRLADRTAARRLAAAQGVPFVILHFEAPPALLRRRLCERAVRANDASEADGSVLALQLQTQEPLLPAERTLTQLVRASAASSAPHCLDWTPLLDRLRRAQQGNGLRHAAA